MWPLFIAGCACFSDEQRKTVLGLFSILDSKWYTSPCRLSLLFYAASQDFSYKSDRVSQKFVHLHPLCTQKSRAMQSRPETTAQTSREVRHGDEFS